MRRKPDVESIKHRGDSPCDTAHQLAPNACWCLDPDLWGEGELLGQARG